MKIQKQEKSSSVNTLGEFFNDIDVEIVKNIDEFNKLIKYTFKRKYSEEFNNNFSPEYQIDLKNYKNENYDQMSHLVIVNYQVIENNNKEEACISIFDFDEYKN